MAYTLPELEAFLATRATASPESSYTAKLLSKGPSYAARKFGEEAIEAIVAAVEGDRKGLILESADVLYHLLVVLRARGVALQDVLDELERRTAQSGLQEKASRPAG